MEENETMQQPLEQPETPVEPNSEVAELKSMLGNIQQEQKRLLDEIAKHEEPEPVTADWEGFFKDYLPK